MEVPDPKQRGGGAGARFHDAAVRYADQTGKRLYVPHTGFMGAQGGMYKTTSPDGEIAFGYDPPNMVPQPAVEPEQPYQPSEDDLDDPFWHEGKARTCPTCNDPLKGEHGTFCPRCQWSENDANRDSDPLSNPPDPTVDMHRGIQASFDGRGWYEAVEDL